VTKSGKPEIVKWHDPCSDCVEYKLRIPAEYVVAVNLPYARIAWWMLKMAATVALGDAQRFKWRWQFWLHKKFRI
jgi:hypothetical protein